MEVNGNATGRHVPTCEARIANGRRRGKTCTSGATWYSPSSRRNTCKLHAGRDAVAGTGTPWWEDRK